MEDIIVNNDITFYYLNDELILTIEKVSNNTFIVEGKSSRVVGEFKKINNNDFSIDLIKNYQKDKLGRWRENKKTINQNITWATYILTEKGFI